MSGQISRAMLPPTTLTTSSLALPSPVCTSSDDFLPSDAFPPIVPPLNLEWPEDDDKDLEESPLEQLPFNLDHILRKNSSEPWSPSRDGRSERKRVLPWWNPYPLADSLVSALRWPSSYASLGRSSEVDSPLALLKAIITALKWPFPNGESRNRPKVDHRTERHGWTEHPEDWDEDERRKRTIPQYVIDHAPLVHLFSGEKYWPCDMVEHLQHVQPLVDYDLVDRTLRRYSLHDLDELNEYGRRLYLTSDDNVEDYPEWLAGEANIPTQLGSSGQQDLGARVGGRSDAPAITIVVDKGDGIVDAFYFFFYSYNLGNSVLNVRFGNHVGDWEHMAVLFEHWEPKAIFFSQHTFGEAYTYDAVEKIGKRPVVYSATGTHAMYSTPDIHSYVLPWGLLHDQTDRGPLWDPLLNTHAYIYNLTTYSLLSSTLTPAAPTEWFYFLGHWGDKAYKLTDRRQYYFAGEKHYVDGPAGPLYKNLARRAVCINEARCQVRDELPNIGGRDLRFWSTGEQLSKAEMRMARDTWGSYLDDDLVA